MTSYVVYSGGNLCVGWGSLGSGSPPARYCPRYIRDLGDKLYIKALIYRVLQHKCVVGFCEIAACTRICWIGIFSCVSSWNVGVTEAAFVTVLLTVWMFTVTDIYQFVQCLQLLSWNMTLIDVLIARQFNDLMFLVHVTLYVSIKHSVCNFLQGY